MTLPLGECTTTTCYLHTVARSTNYIETVVRMDCQPACPTAKAAAQISLPVTHTPPHSHAHTTQPPLAHWYSSLILATSKQGRIAPGSVNLAGIPSLPHCQVPAGSGGGIFAIDNCLTGTRATMGEVIVLAGTTLLAGRGC